MPVFIETTTRTFEKAATSQVSFRRANASRNAVRRPTRGLEIKDDTPAIIKVVKSDGVEIPLVDSSSATGASTQYSNFILQSVNEARMEKHQIVETFGESYIFFFGEQPRFLDVSAVIVNSLDFNWQAEWWHNYENYFRGTKLVEMGARTYLFYDDNVIEGYMLGASASTVADQPHLVQMNFRYFVTSYRNISFIGDSDYPIRTSATYPDNIAVLNPSAINRPGGDVAYNAAKTGGVDDAGELLGDGFDSNKRLSDFLRTTPSNLGISPTVMQRLEALHSGEPIQTTPLTRKYPIRSKIADNRDEYIGDVRNSSLVKSEEESAFDSLIGELADDPIVREQSEVDDLWLDSTDALSCYGADIDNKDSMSNMGLMPHFKNDADRTATYTPVAAPTFNTAAPTFETGSPYTRNQSTLDRRRREPLSAVYGSRESNKMSNREEEEGVGDKNYGYRSDYADGPGYGQAGYGDFGGKGFGSGAGEQGDRGFKDPALFTFKGVVGNEAAFNSVNKSKTDNTVFGVREEVGWRAGNSRKSPALPNKRRIGLGASNAGLSGGGATKVDGKPSPFSLISTEGDLDTSGEARSTSNKSSTGAYAGVYYANEGFAGPGTHPGVRRPPPAPQNGFTVNTDAPDSVTVSGRFVFP